MDSRYPAACCLLFQYLKTWMMTLQKIRFLPCHLIFNFLRVYHE